VAKSSAIAVPQRSEEIQSLAKGFAVIKAFSAERPKLTLAEVSRHTGLTRAGARRVLVTLRSLGYVSSDDRYFRLEARVLELGYSYLASQPWWQRAQQVADLLANKLDEPIAIGVIDHQFVIYIAHARPKRFEAFARSVGTRLPLGTSANGRVLLASLSDEELNSRLNAMKLIKLTGNTITDAAQLKTQILKVRQDGYSLLDQELEVGLRSLAVPIVGRSGQVIAALGMSSSDHRLNRAALLKKYLGVMRSAAKEISNGLPA
jgi:IclR family pca regulon transcriptional regulator